MMCPRTLKARGVDEDERLRRWLIPALDLADEAAKGYSLDTGSPTTDFKTVAGLLARIALLLVGHFERLDDFEKPVTFDAGESRPTYEIGVELGMRTSGVTQVPTILATRLRMSEHFGIVRRSVEATEVMAERLIRDGARPPTLLELDFARFKVVFRGLVELLHEAARDLPVPLASSAHPSDRSRQLVEMARGYDSLADVMRS